jgi:hypothetical protein
MMVMCVAVVEGDVGAVPGLEEGEVARQSVLVHDGAHKMEGAGDRRGDCDAKVLAAPVVRGLRGAGELDPHDIFLGALAIEHVGPVHDARGAEGARWVVVGLQDDALALPGHEV